VYAHAAFAEMLSEAQLAHFDAFGFVRLAGLFNRREVSS
jgi:hypothetical protein